MARLYIQGLRRAPIISDYGSTRLNMSENGSLLLNIPECTLKCLNKLF